MFRYGRSSPLGSFLLASWARTSDAPFHVSPVRPRPAATGSPAQQRPCPGPALVPLLRPLGRFLCPRPRPAHGLPRGAHPRGPLGARRRPVAQSTALAPLAPARPRCPWAGGVKGRKEVRGGRRLLTSRGPETSKNDSCPHDELVPLSVSVVPPSRPPTRPPRARGAAGRFSPSPSASGLPSLCPPLPALFPPSFSLRPPRLSR